MSSYSSAASAPKAANRVSAAHDVATVVCRIGLADVLQGFWIAEHGERFLQLRKILGADDHGGVMAVA